MPPVGMRIVLGGSVFLGEQQCRNAPVPFGDEIEAVTGGGLVTTQ